MGIKRCGWVAKAGPLDVEYHDTEWGVPLYDDDRLFEFLILEGAQAGLSWSTILKKREGYRRALHGFDARRIARYNSRSVERLMNDASIVRNRLKIESTISNARAFLETQAAEGSFADYVWGFVEGAPLDNSYRRSGDLPAKTELSDALSKDLKRRGFRFVGSTICYAFMQAAGLVNDHTTDCFRYREVQRLSRQRRR
ncbi:MAG: DNA-3-methyladenine glycosylase I [Acidobacteria bacterium]|nr:DNA-3-methyladenine glycosylase I [Acidobacteriota bacterium]